VTEALPTSPLAEKALQRLRKLADGNGLSADAIKLFSTEEDTYTMDGVMTLLPLFETVGGRYPGAPRGDRKVLGSRTEMKAEADRLKEAFETRPIWIPEVIEKLKEQPADGWGLDDVKIALPNQSVILAASEVCPQCQGQKSLTCTQCNGQGSIVCPQCQGNRQEFCPVCLGSGQNPSQPNQVCINCNGIRYSPCRFCHGNGHLPCPTCNGSRGTVCSSCRGAGLFTEETTISCGARTQFRLNAIGLPSGLRRGLDRLGIANLAKGHADITSIPPPPDEDDGTALGAPPMPGAPPEPKAVKVPKPEVHYQAKMPYADLRMSFDGKKVIVGIFGKKSVLLNVPAFLDRALEPLRENLQKATKNASWLEQSLEARVMKDALKLQLSGVGEVNALRRIYPLGLSPKVAADILWNMRLALNQVTLRTRTMAAAGGAVLGAALFAGLFLTPAHSWIVQGWPLPAGLVFDLVLLGGVLTGCWFALSAATRFALRKRFPGMVIPLTQKTGKTGYTMLAATAAVFFIIVLLAPHKPEWIQALLGMHK
jgi:hypothetical protein